MSRDFRTCSQMGMIGEHHVFGRRGRGESRYHTAQSVLHFLGLPPSRSTVVALLTDSTTRGFAISFSTSRRVTSRDSLLILSRHRTIVSRVESQERSIQTSMSRLWRCILSERAVLRGQIRSRTAPPLFLQKDVEEGVVDPDLAVVFDEAQLPEAIRSEEHTSELQSRF